MIKETALLCVFLASNILEASDISALLTCLKPEILVVKRDDLTITGIDATSHLMLRLEDETVPHLIIFEDGWRTKEGKSKVVIRENELLTLTKKETFKENELVLKKHKTLSNTDDTSYLSDLKTEGCFFTLRLTEDGKRYFFVHRDSSFAFSKNLFDRTQEIDLLIAATPSIPMINSWCSQHPSFKDMLNRFHKVSLIDDNPRYMSNIPKITHTILTRMDESLETYYLENNIDLLNKNRGWQHVVWLLDGSQMTDDLEKLRNSITVRFVSDLFQDDPMLSHQMESLKKYSYFEMSCYLRYYIINRFGGWYTAPDVELIQPLDRFSQANFVGIVDAIFKPCISTSLFGSIPNAPILQEALTLINQNFLETSRTFGYGKMDAYIKFGFCLFSKCFLSKANDSTDLLLSYSQFPTFLSNNPIRMISDDDFKTEIGTIAVHFTQGDWRSE